MLRLRVTYAAFLRRTGDDDAAKREAARTSGMLEMLASSPEPPASQRFRFASTNGVTVSYRQITVNSAVSA